MPPNNWAKFELDAMQPTRTSFFRAALLVFLWTFIQSHSFAQTKPANNFFKNLNSISVNVSISGDAQACGIQESEIKNTAAFVISNSPLRKIDPYSMDILSFDLIVLNDKTKGNRSIGCSVATNIGLWRLTNFRGSNNLVTVWERFFLSRADEAEISRSVYSVVERVTKEFVVKWSEQQ